MKKAFFLIALGLALTLQAQQPNEAPRRHGHHPSQPPIEQMVSDLSAPQKKKLESLQKASHQRVAMLRKSKHALRDSIHTLMDLEGDHSAQLNPLFEREGDIQTKISKEMYSTRLAVDKILTDKQRRELKTNMQKQRAERKAAHEKQQFRGDRQNSLKEVNVGKSQLNSKKACKHDGACKKGCTKASTPCKESSKK